MRSLPLKTRAEIRRLGGRHLASLEPICAKRPTKVLINNLVLLMTDDDPKIQVASTWLLKRLAEQKRSFSDYQLIAMFDSLATLTQWEAQLHICQILHHVKIPKECAARVAWFLDRSVSESNKFLRAWAYSGFYELAKQHSEYRDYAREQIDRGEADKSAAVKARIRKIQKAMVK